MDDLHIDCPSVAKSLLVPPRQGQSRDIYEALKVRVKEHLIQPSLGSRSGWKGKRKLLMSMMRWMSRLLANGDDVALRKLARSELNLRHVYADLLRIVSVPDTTHCESGWQRLLSSDDAQQVETFLQHKEDSLVCHAVGLNPEREEQMTPLLERTLEMSSPFPAVEGKKAFYPSCKLYMKDFSSKSKEGGPADVWHSISNAFPHLEKSHADGAPEKEELVSSGC